MREKQRFKVMQEGPDTMLVVLTQKSKHRIGVEVFSIDKGITRLEQSAECKYFLGSGPYLELVKMIGFKNRSGLTQCERDIVDLCLGEKEEANGD